MDETSPAATGESAPIPLPRDPPPPPGYVDPLEGSDALDDVAGYLADASSEAKSGSSEQQARRG